MKTTVIESKKLGGGVTDHAALTNLAYADAGHTGFEPALGFTPEEEGVCLKIDQTTPDITVGTFTFPNVILSGQSATKPAAKINSGTLLTNPETGALELNTDNFYIGITTPNGTPTPQYPPSQNGTYVKATNSYASTLPYYATDPLKSLIGSGVNNAWDNYPGYAKNTNERFHIDLGAAIIISQVNYENYHESGGSTNIGCKNFTMWGSNDAAAFAELTYATDTNWTLLTTSINQLVQHVALNQSDPQSFTTTNTTAYRYYAFKFADNWGDVNQMGIRRIVLLLLGSDYRRNIALQDEVLTSGVIPIATTGGRLKNVVKQTAMTAANAGALNTGDATSDTIIGNMRTRINEIETKLKALNLFT